MLRISFFNVSSNKLQIFGPRYFWLFNPYLEVLLTLTSIFESLYNIDLLEKFIHIYMFYIFQNSQENTYARFCFSIKLQALPAILTEHLCTTALLTSNDKERSCLNSNATFFIYAAMWIWCYCNGCEEFAERVLVFVQFLFAILTNRKAVQANTS